MKVSRMVYRGIKLMIAIIFLTAGATKLLDSESFVILVGSYGLVPESWLTSVSFILPLVEIVAAIGLIFDSKWALNIIAGFTVMFIAILSYGVWLGLDIDCGCFGPGDPELVVYSGLRPALYKDLVLLLCVAYLYYCQYLKGNSPKKNG